MKYIFVKILLSGEIRLFLLLSMSPLKLSVCLVFILMWVLLPVHVWVASVCVCGVLACVLTHVWGKAKDQPWGSSLITLHHSFLSSSVKLELLDLTTLAIQWTPRVHLDPPTLSLPRRWDYRPTWDPNSGPHAFKAGTLPAKPSPQY